MCWRLCGLPPATTWPSYRAYVLFCTVWVLWAHLVVARPCGWQGGGTSVVGALEPTRGPRYKGFLSLDLRHMAKLVSVDKTSMVAEVEAGMLGPALEDALRAHDLTWVAMLRCACVFRHVTLDWLVVASWLPGYASSHSRSNSARLVDGSLHVPAVRRWVPCRACERRW